MNHLFVLNPQHIPHLRPSSTHRAVVIAIKISQTVESEAGTRSYSTLAEPTGGPQHATPQLGTGEAYEIESYSSIARIVPDVANGSLISRLVSFPLNRRLFAFYRCSPSPFRD